MSVSKRIQRLREKLQENELDALLISDSENRQYMSGFSGSSGYLIISEKDAILATDFRYTEQAAKQSPDYRINRIGRPLDWFPKLTAELNVKRIGFESQNMTVSMHSEFIEAVNETEGTNHPDLIATTDIVENLRIIKDSEELELLTRAIEISDEALDEVSKIIVPGMTEEQIAWELEKAMRERGAECLAFETIIGAGPNGAMAHHRADETIVQEGQPIVIDMGARYKGYNSDLTRTVFVGEPDDEFRKVYNTVLQAQLAAIEQARSGMTGEQVDTISRDIIDAAGYEGKFGHSLGHGVGLNVHESPRLSQRADDELADGMVFTIEPGIYITGWGGVRIEDVVVLENGRARVLSKASKMEV